MKRRIVPAVVVAMLLYSCDRESKPRSQQSCPPPAQPSATSPHPIEPSSDLEESLGDYVHFPACGIKIRQPQGFQKADSFDGFGNPETQSSVMAVSLAGPYAEISAGFTKDQMKARGWTLRSNEDVDIDGLPGILVHFEQPAGGTVFLKWSLVFDDHRKTTMVTATVPKAQERELVARLRSAVLSTRLYRAAAADPGTDLSFTIAASPKLKLTPVMSRTLGYTKDGVIPTQSPKDPLFIAASAFGKIVAGDKRQFAERRLRQTAHTKQLVVNSTEAITIDGLDGYETLAEAEDAEAGTPLIVYQVILFDGGSYILLQGLVGTELRDEYLPDFKAMARTLRRKQP